MQKKYCPVMGQGPNGLTHCKQEKCAWWDCSAGCCAVISALFSKRLVRAVK